MFSIVSIDKQQLNHTFWEVFTQVHVALCALKPCSYMLKRSS